MASNANKLTVQELIELKERVEAARTKRAQCEGRLSAAMKALDEGFGCKTVAVAQKKLATMREEEATLETEIESDMAKLREDFGL